MNQLPFLPRAQLFKLKDAPSYQLPQHYQFPLLSNHPTFPLLPLSTTLLLPCVPLDCGVKIGKNNMLLNRSNCKFNYLHTILLCLIRSKIVSIFLSLALDLSLACSSVIRVDQITSKKSLGSLQFTRHSKKAYTVPLNWFVQLGDTCDLCNRHDLDQTIGFLYMKMDSL